MAQPPGPPGKRCCWSCWVELHDSRLHGETPVGRRAMAPLWCGPSGTARGRRKDSEVCSQASRCLLLRLILPSAWLVPLPASRGTLETSGLCGSASMAAATPPGLWSPWASAVWDRVSVGASCSAVASSSTAEPASLLWALVVALVTVASCQVRPRDQSGLAGLHELLRVAGGPLSCQLRTRAI